MTEFWFHAFPIPGHVVSTAVQAEAWGFDGMLLADSEILVADPYIELALATQATTRLRLGPGVTNPVTRHAAVTAAALATLHTESGGRAVAVLGRGDSAVRQIGAAPATTARLRQYATDVRAYLGGGTATAPSRAAGPLAWYHGELPSPIHVSIAATGPATIAMAARDADGVDLTVGADPDRVGWGIDVARSAASDLDPRPTIGVWLNVAVSSDPATARDLVRGSAAIFAHFVSEGPLDGLSPEDRSVVEPLSSSYVEREHGLASAGHAHGLPDDFLDRFAAVGTPDRVCEQLRTLVGLGVDRVIVVPGSRDADPELLRRSNELFASEVLPHVR